MIQHWKHLTLCLCLTLVSCLAFSGGAKGPRQTSKPQTDQIDAESSLPLFGCSAEQKLKEIKNHFPHIGEDLGDGIRSDDFLPIWVQNGSIWISTDRELAVQIQHQQQGPKGIFSVVMKNYCAPSEENTAVGTLHTTSAIIDDQVSPLEAERTLPPFPLTGGLLGDRREASLRLTFVPTPNSPGSKGILKVELFSKSLGDEAPVLLDTFSLLNLKELEK